MIECEVCGKSMRSEERLRKHRANAHDSVDSLETITVYSCEICSREFRLESFLNSHMKTHDPERNRQCDKCPKTFKSAGNLARHKASHNLTEYNIIKGMHCKKCLLVFKRKIDLNNHVCVPGKVNTGSDMNAVAIVKLECTFDVNNSEDKVHSSVVLDSCNAMTGIARKKNISIKEGGESNISMENEVKSVMTSSSMEVDDEEQCGVDEEGDEMIAADENMLEVQAAGTSIVVMDAEEGTFSLYQCGVCRKQLRTKLRLMIHMENSHTKEQSDINAENKEGDAIMDDDCNLDVQENGISVVNVTESVATVDTEGDRMMYQCEVCGKQLRTKSCLTTHREKTHSKEQYKCNDCGRLFKCQAYLKNHSLMHQDERDFQCEECPKAFKLQGNLTLHMRHVHWKNKTHVCELCSETFYYKYHLNRHIEAKHERPKMKCEYCPKEFDKKFFLDRHMRSHTNERPFTCTVCEKSFKSKDFLRIHTNIHNGIRKHKCDICEKLFQQASQLKVHMKSHTGEKGYICDVCGHAFIQKSTLDAHIVLHTGNKQHICDKCPKKFATKAQLKNHILCHLGRRDFQCDICDRKFNTKSGMRCHQKLHDGVRNYACEFCGRMFSRNTHRLSHVNSQHLMKKSSKHSMVEVMTTVKHDGEENKDGEMGYFTRCIQDDSATNISELSQNWDGFQEITEVHEETVDENNEVQTVIYKYEKPVSLASIINSQAEGGTPVIVQEEDGQYVLSLKSDDLEVVVDEEVLKAVDNATNEAGGSTEVQENDDSVSYVTVVLNPEASDGSTNKATEQTIAINSPMGISKK